MASKTVDVYDNMGNCVASYPITLGGLNYVPEEREYLEAALRSYREDNPKVDSRKYSAKIR